MPDGLDLSKIKIGDVELVIKDATARQSVLDLIDTIYENNLDIVSRINNLNDRLENVESTSYDYINVRSDWNESNPSSYSYILNKPDIVSNLDKIPLVTYTAASAVSIEPYKLYNFGTVSSSMSISFDTTKEETGYCAEYMFRFTAGNNCNITLPNTVKYNNGERPTTFTNSYIYEYSITDNLCVVGEFH